MKRRDIVLKHITPMANRVIVTANQYSKADYITDGGIVDPRKELQKYEDIQTVLFVSESAKNRGIREGKLVKIDPLNYAIVKQKQQNSMKEGMDEHYRNQLVGFQFNIIIIDGQECLQIYDTDIEYVINECEWKETEVMEVKPSGLVNPNPSGIILS